MKIKNKNDKKLCLEKIDELLEEGEIISRMSNENDIMYSAELWNFDNGKPRRTNKDCELLHKTYLRFIKWKIEIEKLGREKLTRLDINISFLKGSDGVPNYSFGGIGYGNVQSDESHELLKNIRLTTNEKMDWLSKVKSELGVSQNKLITIDNKSGDYLFNGNAIKFKNKRTIYYLVFECFFQNADPNGFCSYSTINKYIEKNEQDKLDDNRKIKDRIKNGIADILRFSDLPKKAPNGKEIIRPARGRGWILYNPQI